MDTKVAHRISSEFNLFETILKTDWNFPAEGLTPKIDQRLLFNAFSSTMKCWLAHKLLIQTPKSAIKLPFGKYRKLSKIQTTNLNRYFSIHDIESIYFLVLLEFFSGLHLDKLKRFQNYIHATRCLKFSGDIRAVFSDIDYLFSKSGGSVLDKKNYRTRGFLLANGFSHIRLDFISGRIRLCPITKDFEPTASLYMSQQIQKDIVPVEVEQTWIEHFGVQDRGFFEIAIDKRVNDFHSKFLKDENTKSKQFTRKVNKNAPKFGIIAMPLFSELSNSQGYLSVLYDKDRKNSMPQISKSKRSEAKSESPKTL